jgi:protein involved in polysaccharide export with SLBB domain
MFSFARRSFATLLGLVLTGWSLLIYGCAGTQSSRSNVIAAAAVGANFSTAVLPDYRIGILDELEIRVRYHERLNGISKVRPDGRITLEDIGDILVAGMTPAQLDSAITTAYEEIIHEPEVTIFVRSFGSLSVYVCGEVRDAGVFEMKPKMTVLQAVAAARGPIRGAKMNSVMLLRRNATGEIKAIRLDLNSTAVRNAAYRDLYVQPEDIIFVPKTFIANVNNFLTQVYDGLFPPVDIYFRALREYNRNNP